MEPHRQPPLGDMVDVRAMKNYFCGSCVAVLEKQATTEREKTKLKALCEMRSDGNLCIWCPRCGVFSSKNCTGTHPVNVEPSRAAEG